MLRHAPRAHIGARCRGRDRTRQHVTHASTLPVEQQALQRQSCYWHWPRTNADVHYERAGANGPAVDIITTKVKSLLQEIGHG